MNWKTKTKSFITGIVSTLLFSLLGTIAGAHYGPKGMTAGLILGGIACISLLITSHHMTACMLAEKKDQMSQ